MTSPASDPTEHTIRSGNGAFERQAWTFCDSPRPPVSAVLFLDGELYLERVQAPAVIQQLFGTTRLPPAVSIFLSNHSAAARHADFTCEPRYAAFVAEDVTGWVRASYPNVENIMLAGLSLSGLASAFAATRYPTAFSATICQSPSFWWEEGRFFKELATAATPGQKLWVSVGDRETDANVSHPPSGLFQKLTQIEGCQAGCAALRSKGYDVNFRTYAGGHDPACWREELPDALRWAWGVLE